jgi:C4-dicarboxylate transporter DctM subunit
MMGQIFIQVRLKPGISSQYAPATWKERLISLKGLIAILVGFVLVMGGLMTGWFTPQEAGAVGTFVMLLVSLPYRQLTLRAVGHAFLEAVKTTAMILLLIFGARYFSYFLTSTEVATGLSNAIVEAGLHGFVVMILVCIVLLVLGMLMDIWSVMIITLPIFFPILMDMGFSPLQMGVITVLCIMIGCITPPVGVVVFTLAGRHREVPMYTIFRGVWSFVATMCVMLLLVIFVPWLSDWLPSFMP